ncbi:hypothetical protein GEMRC1_002323 [Eukaryota sp. GEM-RC1]
MQPPQGTPGCLRNTSMCVLGDFSPFTSTEIKQYCEQYSAQIKITPSERTDFAIVGSNISPPLQNLLKKFQNHTKTITLQQLFDMVKERSRSDQRPTLTSTSQPLLRIPVLQKPKLKLPRSQPLPSLSQPLPSLSQPKLVPKLNPSSNSSVWPDKYRPSTSNDLVGNPTSIKALRTFLNNFYSSKDRPHNIALLSGPPGVGKTSAASLIAAELGYKKLELNASDTRSKTLLNDLTRDFLTSFSVESMLSQGTNRTVLIMDEVDGMSTGDRGG